MNLFSIEELKRFTRAELRLLLDRVMVDLEENLTGSFHHEVALINLRNIRWVLAHYSVMRNDFAPR